MLLYLGVVLAVLTTAHAQADICDGQPDNTFIENVAQCNGWYRCPGAVAGTCPSPFLFNPATRECDWEDNVDCFQCSTTSVISNTAVPGSCTQFIRCINGVASRHVCQNGLLFNNATGQCDVAEAVDCQAQFTCPTNIPPGQAIAFRDTANCSDFHLCVGDPTPQTFECNPVLHFDPITQQCTWPNNTDCPVQTPTPTTTATTTGLPPGDPENGGEVPFNCPGDGHFSHPNTCSSFIVCAAGQPHFFNCSAGLYFNSNTNQCDRVCVQSRIAIED